MTARADAAATATAPEGALPRRVYRRAIARRFVCVPDPAWRLLHDLFVAAGAWVAVLAVLMQIAPPQVVTAGAAIAAASLLGVLAWRQRGGRSLTDGHRRARDNRAVPVTDRNHAEVLRWDGQQWWWHAAGARLAVSGSAVTAGRGSAPASAGCQVTPLVLIDLEQWMLLRLVHRDAGWRFWRHRLLAVSRRQSPGHWSLLRIHLFLARA